MIDDIRIKLACWIHPYAKDMVDHRASLLNDMHNVRDVIGKDIEEVNLALSWILEKNFAQGNPYKKYRSLVHFRDILVNDYKRKLK